MRTDFSIRRAAVRIVLCALVSLVYTGSSATPQSPQEKETSGAQAGSGGKAPAQMGSQGGSESPVKVGDSDTTTKKAKKKKAKKTETNKSAANSAK